MKRTLIAVAVCAVTALPAYAAPETYAVDPGHTFPNFEINHLGFSTARGLFTSTRGTITLDREAHRGSIEIVIDTDSVFTAHSKRDEHLRGEAFFNVNKFPTMTFKSDDLKFRDDTLVRADGDLTLLGKTRPVSLTVTHFKCGENPIIKKPECGADAVTTIKRSEWGMDAYVPAVGDEVRIEIEIEAFKQ